MSDEDIDLLRRYVAEKSEPAFTELVRRHLDLVYGVALRQLNGNVALAEDVAQVVFTLLARKAATLTARPVLGGWLYRATQCAAIDAIRADSRRRARETQAEVMQSLHSDPSVKADWEKFRPTLDRAIAALRDTDRDAIVLRFFEEKSFAEIGARLALTESAARMRVERALEKLRVMLARRNVTSTTAALALALANEAVMAAPARLLASVANTALADAAATSTSVLTNLLEFMSAKLALMTCSVIALLAVGTATYQVRAQHQAEASLALAKQSQQARAAQLRGLQRRVAELDETVGELKANVRATEVIAAGQAQVERRAATWDRAVEGKAFLERHPEVRQAYIEWLDRLTESYYGGIWRSLDLSAAQIEQFKIAARGGWVFDRIITPDKKHGTLKLGETLTREQRGKVYREILGAEGYQRFERLTSTQAPSNDPATGVDRAARNEVKQVAIGLCFSETPLTPRQADELTAIIAESLRTNPAQRDWNAIDAKARVILSPAQSFAWETYSALGRVQRDVAIARMQSTNVADKKVSP